MLSERARACFADIVAAADLIWTWPQEAGGVDGAIFQDAKLRSAIERQLLIISEAAIRLDKLDPVLAPTAAPGVDWPGVRGIGNFIRRRYDDLDTEVIADVLRHRLLALRAAAAAAL
jgi:uncharacterized protein with HEPN domain